MVIKDTAIEVVQGDITELEVDAIVNAANNKLIMGGGVAGAIKKKGGKAIEEEAVAKGPIRIGEAVFTSGGNLRARYVIHAATMGMDLRTDEVKIRNSMRSALVAAEELHIRSIALPALGCGVGGFPCLAAAKIMAQEVLRHLSERASHLRKIVFCLYDEEARGNFENGVLRYLEHIVGRLRPFITVDAIIEVGGGIVVIERSNPPFGWALPGGFVDYGESLEEAVVREAKEETGLVLKDVRQFHTYSAPDRDPRFHLISTVFTAKGIGTPMSGDDAASLKVVSPDEAAGMPLAADHKKVLQDYISFRNGTDPFT